MTEPDDSPSYSPLCQSMTRDGETVQVDIYGDGEGGWLLEVIDEYGNSSVWDDPFATDQGALDEVLKTINEEGIDSLIGSPSEGLPMTGLNQSLSVADLVELDEFLGSEANEDTAMAVSTLEGFLTAIAIGPRMVPPSEWLPWVWDLEEGKAEADFENEAQASRIMSLILRLYNSVNTTFNTEPASFEPIFWRGIQWGAAEWSEGFITGFMFSEEAWGLISIGQPTWFTPFFRLGTDEGIDLTNSGGDAEKWMNEIEPSLVRIHAYWKEKRVNQPAALLSDDYHNRGRQKGFPQVVRGGPKIGRNEPWVILNAHYLMKLGSFVRASTDNLASTGSSTWRGSSASIQFQSRNLGICHAQNDVLVKADVCFSAPSAAAATQNLDLQ